MCNFSHKLGNLNNLKLNCNLKEINEWWKPEPQLENTLEDWCLIKQWIIDHLQHATIYVIFQYWYLKNNWLMSFANVTLYIIISVFVVSGSQLIFI